MGLVLQVLVFTPIGVDVQGNRNWLNFGFVTMQPSELLKVGLALSGGVILSAKRKMLAKVGHALVPYVFPIAMLAIGLVLLGHDLGTVLVMSAVVAGVLFTAGVPARWFALAAAGFAALATTFVVTSPNRLGRFDVWLGRDTDQFGAARQSIHGRYALADGGWTGVGLGQSREKWEWLSEPHNDFIFAIIGEELGLPGTIMVLALFVVLALACYRLVMRSSDFFVRVATAGIMSWIIVQAMINVGAVIGLLPVIGVPLPLVSSGGSSLVTTMLALGILLSFARAEPGCAKALAGRPSLVKRSFAVLPRRRSR
jgi:cell division protein FtsW